MKILDKIKLVLLLLLIWLLSSVGHATEIKELSLEVTRIGQKINHFMPEYDDYWFGGMNLNMDLGFGPVFWENDIYFDGTRPQVRHIGWHFKTDVNVTENVAVFYEHHSQHVAESARATYPLDDRIGIKIYFAKIGR